MQSDRLKVIRADARGDFGDGVEDKLLPRGPPCVLFVGGGIVERLSTRMPCRERIFQILKFGRQFVLYLPDP